MLRREGRGHHVGILVGRRCLIEGPQPLREEGGQRVVDLVRRTGGRVLIEILQQVARVLGEHVDCAGLDLGHVDLTLTDPHLSVHRVPGVLQGLGVDLGDDLVRVVVLRTHDERRRAALGAFCAGVAANRLRRTAGGQSQGRGRDGSHRDHCAFHSDSLSEFFSSSAKEWVRVRSRRAMSASSASVASARATTTIAPPIICA